MILSDTGRYYVPNFDDDIDASDDKKSQTLQMYHLFTSNLICDCIT